METERRIHINNSLDIVVVRMQTREMARAMGFGIADQARISLAASELARALSWDSHSAGEIILTVADRNGHKGLRVVSLINLHHVSESGQTSWPKELSEPSRNLAGACQLVDESIVEEQEGRQARVTLIKWLS